MRRDAVWLQRVERHRRFDYEIADSGAPQLGEIAADAQGGTQIARDGSDVRAAAAVHADPQQWPGVVQHLDRMNLDRSGLLRDGLARSNSVGGALAGDLQRAVCGGHLFNGTMKFLQRGINFLPWH